MGRSSPEFRQYNGWNGALRHSHSCPMNIEEYAQMYRLEDEHWWFVARRRLLARAVDRFPPPQPTGRPPRFLDVGCGTGGTLDWLRPYGQAIGLDMEPLALEFCRQRGYNDLVLASATSLPFADSSIEAVVALDVLEHIADHTTAAREIARILTPGGMLYVTVPAYRSLWSSHDVALMHVRRYLAPEVKELLTGAGLEMVHLTYVMTTYFPLVWFIRTLRKYNKDTVTPHADVSPTPKLLNWALRSWLDVEGSVALRVPFPFGLTVFAAARRPERKG